MSDRDTAELRRAERADAPAESTSVGSSVERGERQASVDRPWVRVATRAGLVAVILLAGLGVFGLLVATGSGTPRNPPGVEARRVVVFELEPTTVSRPWRGYGTAAAVDSADVPARVAATVASIPSEVREGRRVSAGDVLAELDASDFRRTLRAAEERLVDLVAQLDRLEVEAGRLQRQVELEESDVAIGRRELERVERLRASNAAQEQDVDAARRALITAETRLEQTRELLDGLPARRRSLEAQAGAQRSTVEQAEQDLARATIVSPMDGVIESVDVEVGEQVGAGERGARVGGVSAREVPLALPASARGRVVVGDRAELTSVGDGQRWVGEVGRVSPSNDTDARTVTVYVDVNQPGANERFGTREGAGLLVPGVFVSGWATGESREGCWVVPRRSVRQGRLMVVGEGEGDANGVARSVEVSVLFTVAGESVEAVRERTGLSDTEWVVVEGTSERLTAGTRVLLTPPTDLRDGALVEPVSSGVTTAGGTGGGS